MTAARFQADSSSIFPGKYRVVDLSTGLVVRIYRRVLAHEGTLAYCDTAEEAEQLATKLNIDEERRIRLEAFRAKKRARAAVL